MSCSGYARISELAPSRNKVVADDILRYCVPSELDSGFANGSVRNVSGPNSMLAMKALPKYFSMYARENNGDLPPLFDYMISDMTPGLPDPNRDCSSSSVPGELTKGQILIRNVLKELYLSKMSDNCFLQYESLDPTSASSPLIGTWASGSSQCGSGTNCYGNGQCIALYDVNPNTINNCKCMNAVLDNPRIALDILINIYNNRLNSGTLAQLRGTRLGGFFASRMFQNIVSGK